MFNVGSKIKINVRCGKPTSDKATNLIRCWAMDEKGREELKKNNIVEIQFNGDKAKFGPGTEIEGEAIVISTEDAKAYGDDGELQPRFALDADGLPVQDADGKNVVLQRITIRFTSGKYRPALPAEAVLKVA